MYRYFVCSVLVVFHLSSCIKLSRRDSLKVRKEQCCCGAQGCMPRLRFDTAQDVCVRVRLCVKHLLANKTVKIEFMDSESADSHTFLIWKQNHTFLWNSTNYEPFFEPPEDKIQIRDTTTDQTCWILRYVSCFLPQLGQKVNVSVYSQNEILISAEHFTPDPMPKAEITVDSLSKRFTVKVKADKTLKISLCHKHSYTGCEQITDFSLIDPNVNQTVNLSFTYLLPCLCVQLWYTGPDSKRNTQCPLKETELQYGGDILSTSSATALGSVLHWEPVCLSESTNLTASLCWFLFEQDSPCVPFPNADLYGTNLKYNVSAVDKHPQMCVKFSLNGSHRVFCPFMSEDGSEWVVMVVPGSLHLCVHLTSHVAAFFAAQLCAREGDKCVPLGNVHSCHVDGNATETKLRIPFSFLSSGLCVQVWRLDLKGRRIICPDHTHRRWGLIIGAALSILAVVMVVVCITCYLVKRTISVWRSAERRPLLLVCSSDDAAHITAVCSLASGLQDELFMDVRLAQWAHCVSQPSLAQLGPQPWLYGQCQAVQKAGGVILIAWSLDAYHAYLRWRKRNSFLKKRVCNTGNYRDVEGGCENKKMCYEGDWIEKPRNLSLTTSAVFNAALSCLWSGLHSDSNGEGFGLVCFQSLNTNSIHIPKHLRCVQKYSLPRDLSSLIHDLGSSRNGTEKNKGNQRCWPRLFSKGLSFLVSRHLATRLAVKLPVSDQRTPKTPPKFSQKIKGTKQKMLKQKKHHRKVVSSILSRKKCLNAKSAAELLGPNL